MAEAKKPALSMLTVRSTLLDVSDCKFTFPTSNLPVAKWAPFMKSSIEDGALSTEANPKSTLIKSLSSLPILKAKLVLLKDLS